jgi:3-deoxy-manno-octulosonate cytidylyltransferase (CMP-KDO synthetase)
MNIVGVIPARYASTRLPGKPLAQIGDKPMIQRVYERASKSTLLGRVIVATDDKRVKKACKKFDAEVYLTSSELPSGTDRVAAVAREHAKDADVVVNIQGDEPFIPPQMIDQAVEPLIFDPTVVMATLAKPIHDVESLGSPSIVKVVFDYENYALYFSRSPIPFIRDQHRFGELLRANLFHRHVGLYVYRREALFEFTEIEPTDLERAEALEQLRALEHGVKIKVVETEYESLAVDTPEDLETARRYWNEYVKDEEQ